MDARNRIFAVVGTVAIVATAGITGIVLFAQKDTPANVGVTSPTKSVANSATNTNSTQTSTSSSTSSNSSSYKDGTYTSVVSYAVPRGGQNSIKATVVINSDKISSVTTSDNYTDRESGMYVSSFEGSVSSDATGQSIGSYSPSRIGGASLTTSAFNEAITNIATQAKA